MSYAVIGRLRHASFPVFTTQHIRYRSRTDMSGVYAARGFRKLLCVIPRPTSTSRGYSAVAEARAVLDNELDSIRSAGTWKAERVITSKQGPQIFVDSSRNRE